MRAEDRSSRKRVVWHGWNMKRRLTQRTAAVLQTKESKSFELNENSPPHGIILLASLYILVKYLNIIKYNYSKIYYIILSNVLEKCLNNVRSVSSVKTI